MCCNVQLFTLYSHIFSQSVQIEFWTFSPGAFSKLKFGEMHLDFAEKYFFYAPAQEKNIPECSKSDRNTVSNVIVSHKLRGSTPKLASSFVWDIFCASEEVSVDSGFPVKKATDSLAQKYGRVFPFPCGLVCHPTARVSEKNCASDWVLFYRQS